MGRTPEPVMVTGLLAERTGRDGRPEPVVAVAAWTGLDVFRPIGWGYAAWTVVARREELVRPWVAVVVLAVLGVWSVALLFVRRRTLAVVGAEVAIAAAAILATRAADSIETIQNGAPTLPGIWPAGSVVAAAVLLGARGGIAAALVIAVADLAEIGSPTSTTIHNIVLLLMLGGLFGLAVDLARQGQNRLVAALAEQERLRERDRLARVVHDGVLQTLSLIHRRGEHLGGPAGELGRLAAEQEASLRRFVTRPDRAVPEPERTDLAAELAGYDGERVSVVLPALAVEMARERAAEIVAAVAAALDNVSRHAGADARAWVLVEATSKIVRVTVRDDGCGCDPEEVAEAVQRGRVGAAQSIQGRLADLGGHAAWSGRSGRGCTVVMEVPRT